MHRLHVTTSGRVLENSVRRVQGNCPQQTSTHTNADFTGDSFVVQAGFAEDEIAAASYVLPADVFPLRVDLTEMIFATSDATVQTTTHWSVLVWEGTPNTGNLVASFSSDGKILPHLVMPPGTNGFNIAVSVDPGDPEQIIVNDIGNHTFTVGYRIDQHNNQTANPCFTAPPSNSNAFPTTDDLDELASPSGNWLFGVNCGPFGCPANGGWSSFASLPSFCTPGGDWVIRATWSSYFCGEPTGVCCTADGECVEETQTECDAAGGFFEGVGTTCAELGGCPQPSVACCFGSSCLNLVAADCTAAGGSSQGIGSVCGSGSACPIGACCLPDGSCLNSQNSVGCASADGAYQGNGSNCGSVDCPDPLGACCFSTGFCLSLTEADCTLTGSDWGGALTACADTNGNGTPDGCEAPCPADFNDSGTVNASDLAMLLGAWGPCAGCEVDLDGNGVADASDLALLLGDWGSCL